MGNEKRSAPAASMPLSPRNARVRSCWLICGLTVVLVSLGCKEETISRYTVDKEVREEQRFLGAIVEHGNQTWFFKLLGPMAAVSDHEKDVDDFFKSLRFTEERNNPVEWIVPKGWEEKAGAGEFRFRTFLLGGPPKPLELIVTPLGKDAGTLIANVNRWRGQMNLPDIREAELGKVTRKIKIAENKDAIRVDIKTEANPEQADGGKGEKP